MDNIKQEDIEDICFNVSQNIILPKFKNLSDDDINYKNGSDLVTAADIEAEKELKKNLIPTLIVYTRNKSFNLPGKKFVGVKTITYQDLRWKRRDIKTVNLLPNIIAANMAKKKNAYEAILIQNGKVTEAHLLIFGL